MIEVNAEQNNEHLPRSQPARTLIYSPGITETRQVKRVAVSWSYDIFIYPPGITEIRQVRRVAVSWSCDTFNVHRSPNTLHSYASDALPPSTPLLCSPSCIPQESEDSATRQGLPSPTYISEKAVFITCALVSLPDNMTILRDYELAQFAAMYHSHQTVQSVRFVCKHTGGASRW